MEPASARAFADRRWDLVEAEKLRETARFYRERGPAGCLEASDALRAHAEQISPETARDRAEDLRHHIALRLKLDRAAGHVVGRR
jgi:hypothetical protein